ncbi:uncharacterized protein LOC131624205 [Vicia villosa]|uniref:uncharacterized protein LOC131624205 n=1 Tax=Vicia villosa TaxID=3911 RepID=UPI00273A7E48|nr:uncharacterized protein LOC131624205 [Vicia villosa]
MAGRGGRNHDAIAKALGMIAGVLGGDPNGAGIGTNKQLGDFQRDNPPRIFEEDNIKMKSSHSRDLVDRKGKKHMDRGKPCGRCKAVDWKKPSGGDSIAFVRCYNCGETVLFPEAISADDLATTSRQVNEAIEDGATMFMLIALTSLKAKVVSSELPVVCDFSEVFLEDVNELPPEREIEFAIELISGSILVSMALYRMSPSELAELKKQLEELLEKKFICPSVFPWGAPVLSVKKKEGSMRLCLDYQ